jgi:hypothetical protein
MALLSEDDIHRHLANSQWNREGDRILREWEFEDFA